MTNKNMFLLLIAISAIIGTTTSIFQFNVVEAQSSDKIIGSDMLVLTLEDWGGIFPNHVDRIYNSYSGILTIAHNNIKQISIDKSDSQIQDLRSNITTNNFFGLNNEYGQPSDCCDLIHHTLSISMGNIGSQDSKTVYWNDGATFPENLTKIASMVRNLH